MKRRAVRFRTIVARVENSARPWQWISLTEAGQKRVGLLSPSGRAYRLQTGHGKWWVAKLKKEVYERPS